MDRFRSAPECLDAIESQQGVEGPAAGGAAAPAPDKKKAKPALIAAIAAAMIIAAGSLFLLGREAVNLASLSGEDPKPSAAQTAPDLPEASEIVIRGTRLHTRDQDRSCQVAGWTNEEHRELRR